MEVNSSFLRSNMLNVKFDTSSRKRAGRFNLAAALTMRTPMKRKKIVLRPIVF